MSRSSDLQVENYLNKKHLVGQSYCLAQSLQKKISSKWKAIFNFQCNLVFDLKCIALYPSTVNERMANGLCRCCVFA